MVNALSSQQLSALSNLLDLNSSMSTLQTRIATSSKFTGAEGAMQVMRATSMNQRSSNLLAVNSQIDLSVSAVQMAQKGLDKIRSDFNTTLGDLRALKGATQASAAQLGTKTNEVVKGLTASATGEAASLSATAQNSAISASAIRANKKVFGATAPASATSDGAIGATLPPTGQSLRFELVRPNASGNAVSSITAVEFTTSDVGDGSNNLANLTVGDVVKKLNASTVLDTAIGTGEDFQATIDASGSISVSSSLAGARFKVRFGLATTGATYTATPPASQITTDQTTNFGFTYNAANNAGYNTSFATAALPATEARQTPPSLAKTLLLGTRKLFDNDVDATNNKVAWDTTTNSVRPGNMGLNSSNTLSVAVTENGTTKYINLTATQIKPTATTPALVANITVDDFVAAFNDQAVANGLATRAAVDAVNGLSFLNGPVGAKVSFGEGATATDANTAADAGSSNAAFGFGALAQLGVTAATSAVDAANVSLIGVGAGLFQAGDSFSITVNSDDPTRPDTRTINFKAVSASPSSFSGFDGSATRPYEFSSMEDLKKAINTAFNPGQVSAAATKLQGPAGGTTASQFQFELTLNAGYSMEINQTNNVGDATVSTNGMSGGVPLLKNSANALDRLFGSATGTQPGQLASSFVGDLLLSTQESRNISGSLVSKQENYGAKISYTRVAPQPANNGDAKRQATSEAIAKMLATLTNTVEGSVLEGQPNLLKGMSINTRLSDNDSQVAISIGGTVDLASLGIELSGNTYAILANNLGTEADVDNASTVLERAVKTIDGFKTTLSTTASLLASSKAYNTDLSKLLTEAATNLTSNDSTADAAQMQALSTRYQLATGALGLLNQSSQMAAQMLR